jgi:hypothetical protein
MMNYKIKWPKNKKFAFTIFDDTDFSTIKNVSKVYSFLKEIEVLTTKSIWPLGAFSSENGSTCEDKEYLQWVLELQKKGFEIGFHNASFDNSNRARMEKGLNRFIKLFGHHPYSFANHDICKENIYWGDWRLSGINKLIYNFCTSFKKKKYFEGHDVESEYFWGDLCKSRIQYVRNFVFSEINTLNACPYMPYHDSSKPYVNYWFASSEGATVNSFNAMISEKNQDRLEEEGGCCIMYTHFANDFVKNGKLNERFKKLVIRLSKKNGWFVPVNVLLNHLLSFKKETTLSKKNLKKLERKWLINKILKGSS